MWIRNPELRGLELIIKRITHIYIKNASNSACFCKRLVMRASWLNTYVRDVL